MKSQVVGSEGAFIPLRYLITGSFHAFITPQSPSVFHLHVIGLSPTTGSNYFFQCIKGEPRLHILFSNPCLEPHLVLLTTLSPYSQVEERRREREKEGNKEKEATGKLMVSHENW